MVQKYSHQLVSSITFGLTSGVITSLGMIAGLYSATSSKLAVAAGIIVMALADGLADAAGMHLAEESETEGGKVKHTTREIWLSTLFTFLSVAGFILTFAVPILIFPLKTAIFFALGWGILLLIFLNLYIAKIKNENSSKLIAEHLLLALLVIFASHWLGSLIASWLK